MKYQIKISREAEKDLIKAKCYYKLSDQEKAFNNDFILQLKYIEANPFLIQKYYKNIRVIHFKNFKYSIHFLIEKDIVYILRLLHQNQTYDS